MNIEDIRQKYQRDASQTFAQWKEWVRKNKPSQAQAHIVKAVAPNGSKYERLIGGYTDAQNVAFDLVSHGYKDVKLYHSVNAGPLKLLRNFSAPLHGAKFKDSVDFSQDKLLITANGFGNEKGVFRKDPRNGLKPFEVNFYIKGKDGKLFKTGRSKMAASLNEAKQWANSESRKYKNVEKVEVKEFRDSVDFADSVDSIREKYTNDGFLNIDKETRRKIISYLKTRWKLDDAKTNRFIRDFDRDLGDLVKDKEPWDRITKFIDGRVKKIDVNPYSNSYGHSLIAQKYKKPGRDKLRSKDSDDEVDGIKTKYCIDFVMKKDIVRLPNMASYNVEIKINGQPFFPMMTVRDVEGAKKDKIAKQAMEQFKKFHWNNSNSFNRPLDKSKAKLTVGKIQYKPDGRSNWEVMR